MTEAERQVARRLLDKGRRRRVALEDEIAREQTVRAIAAIPKDDRACLHCGAPFAAWHPAKRYCCPQHQRSAWRTSTPEGRMKERDRKKRQRDKAKARAEAGNVRESVAA